MKKYFFLKQIRLVITLSSIFMLNVLFVNSSFVFAASEVNISEKLSQIPDESYRDLYSQRGFVSLTDVPKDFRHLNDGIGEPLQWKQIAVFSYILLDNITADIQNPFELTEADKSQYGLILTRGSDILIVFRGSDRKEESDFLKDLSPLDSVRLYDVYPENLKMLYARHFFDIPDGYSYANRSLASKFVGLLNWTDWSMWSSSANVDKSFLYAALSCQTEVFDLVDQHMSTMLSPQYDILLTGHVAGAGISSLFSALLYQKLKEEGKLREEGCFEEERVGSCISLLNFESPPVFNGIASDIFYEKIGNDNIINRLSPEDQAIADTISNAIKKTIRPNTDQNTSTEDQA